LAFEWLDVAVAEVCRGQRPAPLHVAAAWTEGHLNVLLQFSLSRTFHRAQLAPDAVIRKQRRVAPQRLAPKDPHVSCELGAACEVHAAGGHPLF
jgi:hypothetical protein